jgi:pyrimidine operon attenuation protein/uracil phosphoribosyltransferase
MHKAQLLMDAEALDLSLTRITHQILERNRDMNNFGVVGMQTRGVYLARRIVDKINALAGAKLVAGVLDPTLYRDDYRKPFRQPKVQVTEIPFDIDGINLVLVDDVLYTGRTARASLDALVDFGRPKTIQLAVLVDRGKHELPIRADYVGKKITTADNQEVALYVKEKDGEDALWLMEEDMNNADLGMRIAD